MKQLTLAAVLLLSLAAHAQYGVKAGPNFANVTNASSINNSSRTGFHVGVLLAPPSKSIISSRTELIYSRQGYDYKKGTNTGNVNLDYIQVGQLMSVNFTRLLSVMLGFQTAYLISAKVDSTNNNPNPAPGPGGSALLDLFNRVDYGFAVAAEAHPFKGLLVGARYNISLNKLYESVQTGQQPSFTVADAKNNVVQVYVGWRFGKTK